MEGKGERGNGRAMGDEGRSVWGLGGGKEL